MLRNLPYSLDSILEISTSCGYLLDTVISRDSNVVTEPQDDFWSVQYVITREKSYD